MKNRLTRGNLLATLKVLKKHPRPKTGNPVPASVQAIVPASNPQPKKSKELARAIAERRDILSGGRSFGYCLSARELALLERLATLHDFRMPYSGEQYGELFIHWFYRDRSADRLSRCEIFHLNMLQYFNVLDRVEVIHIRCAARNGMTGAMKQAFEILSGGKAKVDFKIVPQKGSWEYDTFKECCEYAVDTGKFVYYTHFKGVSRIKESALGLGNKYVKDSTDLDILYWCYLMYLGMFTAPSGVKAIGPIRTSNHRRLKVYADNRWTRNVRDKQDFFYRGSFQAFSGEILKSNLLELGVSLNKALPVGTHTVELFLSAIFKESEIYSLPFTKKSMDTPGYHEWVKRVFPQISYLFSSVYTNVDTLRSSARVIVSMTSWKQRIGNVAKVIHSLLEQDRMPDLIELNLAIPEFPNKELDLPKDLQSLVMSNSRVNVNWVPVDTNVFKKIIPTLQKYAGTGDFIGLSVDDDILYSPMYITSMLCLLGDADVACADRGYVGFKSIFHSRVFGSDFWEKLTEEVIACRVSDAYIMKYLTLKKARCVYEPRSEILEMLQDYNPIKPNSSFLDGYSKDRLQQAHRAINRALEIK